MNMRAARWAVAALLVLTLPLAGQQRRGPGPGMDRAEMQRRIQLRFGEIVRNELGLDEHEARALGDIVRSFQEERQALVLRERQLRRRALGQAGGGAPARRERLLPDEEARELLGEMAELRVAEAELYRREQERLLEVLTPGQVVRFHVLREEMAERLRRIRGGPPPGGGPGGAAREGLIGWEAPLEAPAPPGLRGG